MTTPSFVRAATPVSGGEFDSNITVSIDSTGCNYLDVNVHSAVGSNNVTTPAITWNGSTSGVTQLGASTLGPSNRARTWKFRVLGPTGTHNIVFTHVGSLTMDRIIVEVAGYADVDQTTPNGTVATNNGDSGSPSVSVASAVGDLVVDGMSIAGSGTVTATGTGHTARSNAANTATNGKGAAGDIAGAATNTSCTYNSTAGDEWGMVGVALKGTSGGTTVSPSGIAMTMSVGTPTIQTSGNNTVAVSGIGLTMSVGTFTVRADTTLLIPGIAMSMVVGTPTISATGNKTVAVSGIALSMLVGTPIIIGPVAPAGGKTARNLGLGLGL